MAVTTSYMGFDGQLDYEKDKLDKFVPTVLIGLGGTGREVMLRFRKNMSDEYPIWQAGCLKYLLIDTDDQTDTLNSGPPGMYDGVRIRRDQNEFVPTGIAPQEYREALNNLKQRGDRRFKNWMHPDFELLVPPRTLENGSGTIRQAGRLAFFLRYQTIRDVLERQIRSVLDFAAQHPKQLFGRPGSVDDNRLEVVIVTSLAGGTGAGMFMDLAYLVRDILDSNSDLKRVTTHSTLISVLPNIYCSVHPNLANRFQQNAYAALLEMEHYNTARPLNPFGKPQADHEERSLDRPSFRVNWSDPSGSERDLNFRPWDTCYLVDDTHDYARTRNRTKEDVCQMIADYLFLDFGNNPFAIAKRSARSNHTQLTDRRLADQVRDGGEDSEADAILYENYYGCTYSSFGLAEVFFDRERLYRIAGYRLAQILVDDLWLQTRSSYPEATYKTWASEDLTGGRIPSGEQTSYVFNAASLMALLLGDKKSGLPKIVDDTFQKLDSGGPYAESSRQISKSVQTFSDALDAATVNEPNSARNQMLTKCQEHLGRVPDVGKLRNRIRALLRERFAKIGVNPVLQLAEEFRDSLEKSSAALRKKKGQEPTSLKQGLARLTDAEAVPIVSRRTAVRTEFHDAVDGARRHVHELLESVGAEYAEMLATELRNFVDMPPSNNRPPYKTTVESFSEVRRFLEKLSQQLERQFTLHSQIQTNERKQSLLPVQSIDEYNDLIRMSLLNHPEIGPETIASSGYDSLKAERQVLNLLPQQSEDATPWTRATIMDAWLGDYRDNPDILPAVAETLAKKCQDLLRECMPLERFKGGNVVDLMIVQDSDRAERVTKMVDGSTVSLPMANIDKDPQRFRPAWRNLLGITPADANDPKSQKNAGLMEEQVSGVNAMARGGISPDRQVIHETTSAFESRMVLVRELAGIPLHAYDRLGELAKSYFSDAVRQQRELSHVRWRDTFEELPDIERISSDEYYFVQQEVLNVLRGIMLQFIRHDQDGRFSVKITDERKAGETVFSLGSRITRVIKHASVRPAVVRFLRHQWGEWQSKVATSNGKPLTGGEPSTGQAKSDHSYRAGLIYAIFYNAIQQTLDEFPRVVEYRSELQRIPLQYTLELLEAEIRQTLCASDEGRHYYDQLRRRTELDADQDEWRMRFKEICAGVREHCLKKVSEAMPFYTLKWKEFRDITAEFAEEHLKLKSYSPPSNPPEVSA
ncbi:MAG: tubulin-like doman-containing protein [Planctomycetaceae bacterium]